MGVVSQGKTGAEGYNVPVASRNPMPSARLALALAVLATCVAADAHAQSPSPLRVIRSSPTGNAVPTAEITVTFDRPVAGSLDRSVDAATIFRIEPVVRGR